MKTAAPRILIAVTAVSLILGTPEVWAGCGCDHPTPCPAPVMPGFASPGDRVRLTGEGFSTDENGNKVLFGESSMAMGTYATAVSPERMFVNVPERSYSMYMVGPMPILAKSGRRSYTEYGKDSFTYLNEPLKLEEGQGHYLFSGYRLAVDSFGVLYIPLDVSDVREATHFMVYVDGLPLEFSTDDMLIYNKDGFNLNLFTLDVEGYEKQWGDWYGAQGMENSNPENSDLFTYWRHDFSEYHAAHEPGGEYNPMTENEDGYLVHPDGTIHVDHDRLVVAVAGKLRDPSDPDQMTDLTPGSVRKVKIHVFQLMTDDPDAWLHLSPEQEKALAKTVKMKKKKNRKKDSDD